MFVGKKRESAEGALPFSHERNTNAVWPYSLLTLYWINECVIMIVFKSLRTTETGVGFECWLKEDDGHRQGWKVVVF